MARMPRSGRLQATATAVACLGTVFAVTVLTSASGKTKTIPAQVLTLNPGDGSCSEVGFVRWRAVKGVLGYTVLYNDSANHGPQRFNRTKPWPDDLPFGGVNPPLNAPGGTHQMAVTGVFGGSPPCPPFSFSGRLTNPRVQFKQSAKKKIVYEPLSKVPPGAAGRIEVARGEGVFIRRGTQVIPVKVGDYVLIGDRLHIPAGAVMRMDFSLGGAVEHGRQNPRTTVVITGERTAHTETPSEAPTFETFGRVQDLKRANREATIQVIGNPPGHYMTIRG
jgi:hypothetical protein